MLQNTIEKTTGYVLIFYKTKQNVDLFLVDFKKNVRNKKKSHIILLILELHTKIYKIVMYKNWRSHQNS